MDDFYHGLFLGFLICVSLFLMTPVKDGVTHENYERAVEVCAPNGGVEKVFRPEYLDNTFEVLCENENIIKLPAKALPK